MKRLDAIYLQNGPEDFYYRRRRDNARFVLMGCPESCGTGFCVSMGTSRAEDYDLYLKITQDSVLADCPNGELEAILLAQGNAEQLHVVPDSPASNPEKVTLPANLSVSSFSSPLWEEYGNRCIGCGRCNFVCPTCTCFTMQDIHYQDNGKVGERRRVWAFLPGRRLYGHCRRRQFPEKNRVRGCASRSCTKFMIFRKIRLPYVCGVRPVRFRLSGIHFLRQPDQPLRKGGSLNGKPLYSLLIPNPGCNPAHGY